VYSCAAPRDSAVAYRPDLRQGENLCNDVNFWQLPVWRLVPVVLRVQALLHSTLIQHA
jgi:hypothetical protein